MRRSSIARLTTCAAGRTAFAAGLVTVLARCAGGTPTGDCTPALNVVGRWAYQATQDAPTRASLSGTLTVAKQSCNDFNGTLNVVETNVQGQSRQLGGVVNGRVIDATTLRFDAFLNVAARQHIGAVRGDSLVGTWVEAPQGSTTITGGFHARREGQQ